MDRLNFFATITALSTLAGAGGLPVAVRGVADPPSPSDAFAAILELEIEGGGAPVSLTRIALPCDDKPGDAEALVLVTDDAEGREIVRLPLRPAAGESTPAYVYSGQAVPLPTGSLRIVAPVDSAWMRLASRRKLPRQLELTLVRADNGAPVEVDLRTVKRPRGTDPERIAGEPVDSLLAAVSALVKEPDGTLRLPEGAYHLDRDLVIPRGATVRVDPGTTLLLAPGRNLFAFGHLQMLGTAEKPITVAPLGRGAWATISVLGTDAAGSRFEHVRFIRGSAGIAGALDLNGAVSIIDASATFIDCRFESLRGEDGVHAERSDVTFDRCTFVDVVSDGIDLVQATATVSNSRFERIGDDALDAGHNSTLTVRRAFIRSARGKAVSTGQGSSATVAESFFVDCGRGVSAFDGSTVTIDGSAIVGSSRASVQAAGLRSGEVGHITLRRTLLWQNGSEGNETRTTRVDTRDDVPVNVANYVPTTGPGGITIGPAAAPDPIVDPPDFKMPVGTATLFTGNETAMGGAPPLPRSVWLKMLLGTLAAVALLLLLERRLRRGRS